jgi:hypothetical protein
MSLTQVYVDQSKKVVKDFIAENKKRKLGVHLMMDSWSKKTRSLFAVLVSGVAVGPCGEMMKKEFVMGLVDSSGQSQTAEWVKGHVQDLMATNDLTPADVWSVTSDGGLLLPFFLLVLSIFFLSKLLASSLHQAGFGNLLLVCGTSDSLGCPEFN